MNDFILKEHYVKAASFSENRDLKGNDTIDVNVDGEILMPADIQAEKHVSANLKIRLGKETERFCLVLDTVSIFTIKIDDANNSINEEEIRSHCIPIALAELRKTVRKVTEAYGLPAIDLPPFEDET